MGKLRDSVLDLGPVIGAVGLVLICMSVMLHEKDTDMHHCHDKAHNINIERDGE